MREGVEASPPARGGTPAPRPNHNDYRYISLLRQTPEQADFPPAQHTPLVDLQ